jgi:hypothetical protein
VGPAGWDPAWDDAAKALAGEALAAPLPAFEETGWSARGPYFRFAGDTAWYGGDSTDTPASVYPFAVDVRRRGLVRETAERLGHPPEVVELARYLLPYRSVQPREGWDAWSERQNGEQPAGRRHRVAGRVAHAAQLDRVGPFDVQARRRPTARPHRRPDRPSTKLVGYHRPRSAPSRRLRRRRNRAVDRACNVVW